MSEKRKLLLADDSVTVQKVVNLAFESENIEIVAAHDGDSALEMLNEFTPDLIMADVNMPGADGYDICERIKQNEATRHIPVILLVGSFEPFSEDKARRVGADDFLKKPFQSINLLIDKVHDLLERGGGEEEEIREETDFREADTQPMPVYQMPASSTEESFQQSDSRESYGSELGEAGMDDEMIETRQVGDYPIMDETSKYENHAAPEETADFQIPGSETEGYAASESYGYETVEEFPQAESEETSSPPVYEIAEEPEESYQDYSAYGQETEEESSAPPTSSALNFNDADLLEIPPLDTDQEISAEDYSAESETRKTTFETEGDTTTEPETVEETQDYPSYAETEPDESFDEQMESAETFQEESAQTEAAEDYYTTPETTEAEEAEGAEEYVSAPVEEEETEETTEYYSEEQTAQFSDKTTDDIPTEEETRMAVADETQEIVKAADNELIVHYFPPEVIDAIAEKVVEKLAEKLRK